MLIAHARIVLQNLRAHPENKRGWAYNGCDKMHFWLSLLEIYSFAATENLQILKLRLTFESK